MIGLQDFFHRMTPNNALQAVDWYIHMAVMRGHFQTHNLPNLNLKMRQTYCYVFHNWI